jgi:SAM-dependent methyltransferase
MNFNPYIRYHYANQTKEIVEFIKKSSNLKLLEVGSGCGSESLYFSYLGANVKGIDISKDRLHTAIARKKLLGRKNNLFRVDYICCSVFDINEKFDLIYMEQTFHHIEPREAIYKKLNALLSKGGRVFVSESNGWNILVQLQLFLRRGWNIRINLLNEDGNLIPYGNERITTPFFLIKEFKKHGFDVETVRYFRMFPNFNLTLSWLKIENFLVYALPFLATHYNIVFRKNS